MKQKPSRLLAALLILCMTLALLPGTALATESPETSSNVNRQDYTMQASIIDSYLYENKYGGLTRVENISKWEGGHLERYILAEDYSSDFVFQRSYSLPIELDGWGGFFAGESYNFLVFIQGNLYEDDNKEVIRVVKYSKDWQRLGQASLYGANTTFPIYCGTLRAAEYDGELYIRTCHNMYSGHQANMTMVVQEKDMTISDSFYRVSNNLYGYVSHSFNQFVIVDQQQHIVTLDHGDAHPCSAVLMVYDTMAGQGQFSGSVSSTDVVSFSGSNTGASLGGLAETVGGYVVAYNYAGKASITAADRSVYFAYVDKDSLSIETKTVFGTGAMTPVLAPIGLTGGYILLNASDTKGHGTDTLYYAAYSDGGRVGEVKVATAALSDCQPIYYNGKVVWYATNNTVPTFYLLDENGVTAVEVQTSSTPTPSSVSVIVNGKAVTWTDAAPFIDVNSRTMVPLRAVADAMGLDVNWDATAREAAFTGSGKTITFPIDSSTARVSDGEPKKMDTAAVIVNERTYAPVRVLAEYFGFTVGWDDATRTVIITG